MPLATMRLRQRVSELGSQSGSKQVVGTVAFRRLWTHRESSENCRAESDYRQFAILLPASESLILPPVPCFSGATIQLGSGALREFGSLTAFLLFSLGA